MLEKNKFIHIGEDRYINPLELTEFWIFESNCVSIHEGHYIRFVFAHGGFDDSSVFESHKEAEEFLFKHFGVKK